MSKSQIRKWMRTNAKRFVESGEVNCTQLIEAWDDECADGETTLDLDHIAWDIAVDVSIDYTERRAS